MGRVWDRIEQVLALAGVTGMSVGAAFAHLLFLGWLIPKLITPPSLIPWEYKNSLRVCIPALWVLSVIATLYLLSASPQPTQLDRIEIGLGQLSAEVRKVQEEPIAGDQTKAGEDGASISISFREQSEDGSFTISIRNDGAPTALIEQLFVCESDRWSIRHRDGRVVHRMPLSAQLSAESYKKLIRTWEFASLTRSAIKSSADLTLDCPRASTRRLNLSLVEGTMAVPGNGGTAILRADRFPARWTIPRIEGKTLRWNDQCPIQIVTDQGWILIAPLCVDSTSSDTRLFTIDTKGPVSGVKP